MVLPIMEVVHVSLRWVLVDEKINLLIIANFISDLDTVWRSELVFYISLLGLQIILTGPGLRLRDNRCILRFVGSF